MSIVNKIDERFGRGTCWIDTTGIESGSYFRDTIMKAIKSADVCIFLMSKDSVVSSSSSPTWVQKEVLYAIRKCKKFVPVSIDGTTLDDCDWLLFECGDIDYSDWRNPHQQVKLLKDLKSWLSLQELPPVFDKSREIKKEYKPKEQESTVSHKTIDIQSPILPAVPKTQSDNFRKRHAKYTNSKPAISSTTTPKATQTPERTLEIASTNSTHLNSPFINLRTSIPNRKQWPTAKSNRKLILWLSIVGWVFLTVFISIILFG